MNCSASGCANTQDEKEDWTSTVFQTFPIFWASLPDAQDSAANSASIPPGWFKSGLGMLIIMTFIRETYYHLNQSGRSAAETIRVKKLVVCSSNNSALDVNGIISGPPFSFSLAGILLPTI